jgi:hypothetical protein
MDLVGLVLGSSTQRRVNHPACARVLAKWPCTWGLEVSSGHLPETSAGFRARAAISEVRSGRGSGRWRTSFEFYVLFIDRVLLHNSDFQKPDLHGIVV